MFKSSWKKALLIFDLCIILFTVSLFLYKLLPIFHLLFGYHICYNIFDMRYANIFGFLFIVTLLKSFFGIIMFLILLIKKQKFNKNIQNYFYFLWVLFSVLIITYSIILLTANAYIAIYNLVYAMFIIIGTFCWIKIVLNNISIKKNIEKIFISFNLISNYLLIIM